VQQEAAVGNAGRRRFDVERVLDESLWSSARPEYCLTFESRKLRPMGMNSSASQTEFWLRHRLSLKKSGRESNTLNGYTAWQLWQRDSS